MNLFYWQERLFEALQRDPNFRHFPLPILYELVGIEGLVQGKYFQRARLPEGSVLVIQDQHGVPWFFSESASSLDKHICPSTSIDGIDNGKRKTYYPWKRHAALSRTDQGKLPRVETVENDGIGSDEMLNGWPAPWTLVVDAPGWIWWLDRAGVVAALRTALARPRLHSSTLAFQRDDPNQHVNSEEHREQRLAVEILEHLEQVDKTLCLLRGRVIGAEEAGTGRWVVMHPIFTG